MKELEKLEEEVEKIANHVDDTNAHMLDHFPFDINPVYDALEAYKATLSPRPIEEAPEEWFDGRKMLVFDEEYEEWLIAIHVSNIGWAIYEHGKHFTLLYQVTKLLPLPSMDGGEK